jgi:DNA polymerase I
MGPPQTITNRLGRLLRSKPRRSKCRRPLSTDQQHRRPGNCDHSHRGFPLVGLDTETTGLDPRTDRVRLLTLAVSREDGASFAFVLDLFELADAELAPLWDALALVGIVGHTLAFDLRFLRRLGFVPQGRLCDLLILARLLSAGNRSVGNRLADLAERYLDVKLDKTEQKGDWGARS